MKVNAKCTWLAVAPFTLALLASPVQADTVEAQFFLNELNQISDNSAESQGVDSNGNNRLDVGDTLRGVFDIQTNECVSCIPSVPDTNFGPTNNEFSGIFEIEVYGKRFVDNGPDMMFGTGDDNYEFDFGPNAAFAAEFGLTPGTMIAFWEDAAPGDFDRTGSIATGEMTATNGMRRMDLGVGTDPGAVNPGFDLMLGTADDTGAQGDELWRAVGPEDPSTIGNLAPGSIAGGFNFQLSVLMENFGLDFGVVLAGVPTGLGDGMIGVNASGSVLGTAGLATGFDAFNNVDATFRTVPEPGLLALLGAGMLAFGASRLRGRKGA